jgi:hypothetical protein
LFVNIVGIYLDKGHPVSEIGDFFELHDLIIVVDCFFVECIRQHVDDELADTFEVEDASNLYVHKLLIVLFAPQSLVY